MMGLFHQREELLSVGELIEPGGWGKTVLTAGQDHRFFFREQFLELWRVTHTECPVSRLNCTFAFEEASVAAEWAADGSSGYYAVEPVDLSAPHARLDMLWLTWLGESNATFERTVAQCKAYWDGESTSEHAEHAHPTWERLFGCPLRVVERLS
jgi:hypothetical protein